jgi:hypothetical protein
MTIGRLTPRNILLAEAIANGMTRRKAAEFSGLTEKGVEVALKRPHVKAEIERRVAEITKATRGALRGGRFAAVAALVRIAKDTTAPPAAQVNAAIAILDRIGVGKTSTVEVLESRSDESPEDRLARLSERLGAALATLPPPDEADDDDEGADDGEDDVAPGAAPIEDEDDGAED